MGCICGAAACRTGNSCSSSSSKPASKEVIYYDDDPLTTHKLNRLTAHLCFVLHSVEAESPAKLDALLLAAERHEDGEGLIKWWAGHQKQDAERLEREKAGRTLAEKVIDVFKGKKK